MIFIIIVSCILLKELYTTCYHGKLIIKLYEGKAGVIYWIVLFVLWCPFLFGDIMTFLRYHSWYYINDILLRIFGVEIFIINIIAELRYSEIRENGIYNHIYFHRWHKIRSYNWVSSNTIKFKVNIFMKINVNFKLTVTEPYDKLKIDEVLNKYIGS